MQNANIIVCKYKFKTIMTSCQTIGKGEVAWNLLLYLQMQQYLQWFDIVLHNPVPGKGRIMESKAGKLWAQKNTAFKESYRKAQRVKNGFKVSVSWTFMNSHHASNLFHESRQRSNYQVVEDCFWTNVPNLNSKFLIFSFLISHSSMNYKLHEARSLSLSCPPLYL